LIHKYTLLLPVPAGGYPPITLPHEDTGHSLVITKYLDLIYSDVWVNLDDGLLNRRVIRLARKWESLIVLDRMAKDILLLALSDVTLEPRTSWFITAVGLEDPVLLGTIIAKTGQRRWNTNWSNMDYTCDGLIGVAHDLDATSGAPFLYEFGCWPLEEYLSIPPAAIWYFWAELQGPRSKLSLDWSKVGEDYNFELRRAST
jgi:hypothetical protein